MSTLSQDELAAAIRAARQKASDCEGGDRPGGWRWGDDDEADGLELVGRVEEIEEDVPGPPARGRGSPAVPPGPVWPCRRRATATSITGAGLHTAPRSRRCDRS
jgi:hypothetical protein